MRLKKLLPATFVLLFSVVACQYSSRLFENTDTAYVLPTLQAPSVSVIPVSSVNPNLAADQDLLVRLYERSVRCCFDSTGRRNGKRTGSGFVYSSDGYIITNFHVVEGATDLEVDFPSGYKTRGVIRATDLDSDLAVIKVNAPAEELRPLPLGDSDLVKVGQTVVAIGNPFGLNNTMTMGIISAKGRTLDSLRQTEDGGFYSTGDLLQTDASINPGNSGGPLLNLNGEVIGLNRSIRTTGKNSDGEPVNSGIGFAVSVNIIKRVVPVLIQKGVYDIPIWAYPLLPVVT
jgi:2-alkenal reductase